jgi:hypothetical protein
MLAVIPCVTATIPTVNPNSLTWQTVDNRGIGTPVNYATVTSQTAPAVIRFDNGSVHKSVQVLPGAKVAISEDLETVMMNQSTNGVFLQLYYGYHTDAGAWSHYYKADSIRTIYGNYTEHRIWMEPTNTTRVNEILVSGEIPEWGDLQ